MEDDICDRSFAVAGPHPWSPHVLVTEDASVWLRTMVPSDCYFLHTL